VEVQTVVQEASSEPASEEGLPLFARDTFLLIELVETFQKGLKIRDAKGVVA
jgi:hypothetical protein